MHMQCSAEEFQNLGQCPTTFEKMGTFPKIVDITPDNGIELKKGMENTIIL